MVLKDPIIDPGGQFAHRVGQYLCRCGFVLATTSGEVIGTDRCGPEIGILDAVCTEDDGRQIFLGIIRVSDAPWASIQYALSCEVFGRQHHDRMTQLSQDLSVYFETLVTCRLSQPECIVEQGMFKKPP